MGELVHHLLHDPEEADEALSLCDLPTDTDDNDNLRDPSSMHTRRSSSEFFEFFNDLNYEMCSAEDIIFCGKLVPFKEHPRSTPPPKSSIKDLRKRSESLPSGLIRPDSHKTRIMRNSKSMDCGKLQRSSPALEMERNPSVKSVGKSDAKRVSKPPWFVLMFGMVKFPPEMDLGDIKNRQVRRNPATMFPPVDVKRGRNFPVNRSSGKGSWGLLSVLSCKGHASVAVTASLGCMPKV